jgi:nitrate reductase NapA
VFATGFVDIGYGMRTPDHPKFTDKEKETVKHEVAKKLSADEGKHWLTLATRKAI